MYGEEETYGKSVAIEVHNKNLCLIMYWYIRNTDCLNHCNLSFWPSNTGTRIIRCVLANSIKKCETTKVRRSTQITEPLQEPSKDWGGDCKATEENAPVFQTAREGKLIPAVTKQIIEVLQLTKYSKRPIPGPEC